MYKKDFKLYSFDFYSCQMFGFTQHVSTNEKHNKPNSLTVRYVECFKCITLLFSFSVINSLL